MISTIPMIVYVLLCLMVTVLAFRERGGFLLYLMLSLALTPVVGLLILFLANPDFARLQSNHKTEG
jgi:hypothetical protein